MFSTYRPLIGKSRENNRKLFTDVLHNDQAIYGDQEKKGAFQVPFPLSHRLRVAFLLAGCSLGGCQVSTSPDDSPSSQLAATSSGVAELKTFCDSALGNMGEDFKTVVGYLCSSDDKELIKGRNKVQENAYKGTGDASKAVYQIKLESAGKTTSFAFLGAVVVPKSLRELDIVRKKTMELGLIDSQLGVQVTYSVVKETPTSKPNHRGCYDLVEQTKAPIGGTKSVNLRSCFYGVGNKVDASYQHEVDGNPANNTVIVRLQVADRQTMILVATSKNIDNFGLASIAESVVQGQAPQLVIQYYSKAKQAPNYESLPPFVTFDSVVDHNRTAVTEDWSWGRTKLSCAPLTAVVAVRLTPYEPLKPKSLLQIDCGLSMKSKDTNTYRYVEAKEKTLPTGEISCNDKEYVAGVSYHRYSDQRHVIDGVKSLLCMGTNSEPKSCTDRFEACSDGEYVKGLKLDRVAGFICQGQRADDSGSGCYRAKKVTCCK